MLRFAAILVSFFALTTLAHDLPEKAVSKDGRLNITLDDVLKDPDFYTSAITGRKIKRSDVDSLATLAFPDLVRRLSDKGVDIAFYHADRSKGDALNIENKNSAFSEEEMNRISSYYEGVTKTLSADSGRTSGGTAKQNHDVQVGGLNLAEWEHLQGGTEGDLSLIKRERSRALIILNAEGDNLKSSTLHEYLHTRFAALDPTTTNKEDEKFTLRDNLVKSRFDLQKKLFEIAAEQGMDLRKGKIAIDISNKNRPKLKKFVEAFMDHSIALIKLDVLRSMDEFDALSVQLANRKKFGYSDALVGSYLRYLVGNINHGRAVIRDALDNPLFNWAVQNNLGIEISEKYDKFNELFREYMPILDRAEFYARQEQFEKYIPELKGLPPGYSSMSYK